MTLRSWSLRPGELRPLSRAGLIRLAARCAMRVDPWTPPGATKPWRAALAHVARAADAAPAASTLGRSVADLGAAACNRLEPTDELRARSVNYAALTLAAAVETTTLAPGPRLKRTVVDAARYAGSIAALHAHAGRARAPAGTDAVELAYAAMMSAIRADIPVLAAAPDGLTARALRDLAPLWPRRAPAWASPAPAP